MMLISAEINKNLRRSRMRDNWGEGPSSLTWVHLNLCALHSVVVFRFSAKKTQKVYKWILPHICNENKPGSVQLPPSGPLEKCPPCNPGMQMSNGVCEFCGSNQYSDGIEPCAPCRGSTAPETGIFYQWWNNLPPNANISFFCLLPAG